MNQVVYSISLDVKKNTSNKVMLGAITGENASRRIEITLMESGRPFVCENSVQATVYVLKPNQTVPSVNGATIAKNVITYHLLGSDLDTVGVVTFQVKLTDMVDGKTVTLITTTFEAEVDSSIIDDSGAPSQPTFTALELALSKVAVAQKAFEEEVPLMIEAVETVTELAERETATLNTAEGYMNSAKDSADNAKQSEQNASLFANSASTQASTAVNAAAEAQRFADNAKESEENAAVYEENAKISEINAAASESLAKNHEEITLTAANAARESEINALTSEVNAEAAKKSALTSENHSKISEDNAFIYQSQAHDYAESIKGAIAEIDKRLGIANFDVDENGNLTYTDDSGYSFEVNDNGNLMWEVI